MDSKNIILASLILFIIFTSGCVLQNWQNPFDSKTPEGSGVIIEYFGGDIQDNIYYSGEKVTFLLKVKNTGSVKAEEGFAELLGLDYSWRPAGSKLSQTGELFPEEEACRYTNKKITLLAPDPERGTEGSETVCTWKYIAPDVLPGITIDVKPRARFYYTYKSSTVKTITLVGREELKVLQEQGKSLPIESYTKTNSPISIDIETATPIRVYDSKVEFPIVVTVKNTGGGTPCLESSKNCKKEGGVGENENWHKIDIKITLPSGLLPAENSCKANNNVITERVFFVGNSPQSFSCKIVGEIPSTIGITQKTIKAEAVYGYFIDKTTEVVVYSSTKPNAPQK
jgi:hypothetical protein